MQAAVDVLKELGISSEMTVASAHRSPERVHAARARGARPRRQGLHRRRRRRRAPRRRRRRAHDLPVIGVPIDSSALKGLDALLSTVQMPPGVPVATVSIGKPGATNAGVLAAQILGVGRHARSRNAGSRATSEARGQGGAGRRRSCDALSAIRIAMPSVKYSIVTFGCRVNQADSLRIEEDLRARGGVDAPSRDADLVVVNTCSVTATADQGARQTIRRIARENPARAHRRDRLLRDALRRTTSPRCPASSGSSATTDKIDFVGDRSSAMRPDDGRAVRCRRRRRAARRSRRASRAARRSRCACRPAARSVRVLHHPDHARARPQPCRSTTSCREIERVAAPASRRSRSPACTSARTAATWRRRRRCSRCCCALDAHSTRDVTFRVSSLEPMDCTPDDRAISWPRARPLRAALPSAAAARERSDARARCGGRTRSTYYRRAGRRHPSRGCRTRRSASDMIVGFPGRDRRRLRARTSTYLAVVAADAPARLPVFGSARHRRAAHAATRCTAPVVRDAATRLREIGAELTRALPRSAGRHRPARPDARGRHAGRDRQLSEGEDPAGTCAERRGVDVQTSRPATRMRLERPVMPIAAAQRSTASASRSRWPGDFWRADSVISWPHAARMSRPRLLRTDTVDAVLGEDLREAIDARVRRPLERNARPPRSAAAGSPSP